MELVTCHEFVMIKSILLMLPLAIQKLNYHGKLAYNKLNTFRDLVESVIFHLSSRIHEKTQFFPSVIVFVVRAGRPNGRIAWTSYKNQDKDGHNSIDKPKVVTHPLTSLTRYEENGIWTGPMMKAGILFTETVDRKHTIKACISSPTYKLNDFTGFLQPTKKGVQLLLSLGKHQNHKRQIDDYFDS